MTTTNRPTAIAALAAILSALAAGTAAANGSLKDAPIYEPTASWTGYYLGAHLGGGFGTSEHSDAQGPFSDDFDVDGLIGGATYGYNYQAGQWVWGAETDISLSGIEGSDAACCSTSLDWLWTLRGRIGYDYGGIMPYLTAGLAVGDVEATNFGFTETETLAGYTVGGGIEWRIDRNWSLKGEYLFVDLGEAEVDGTTAAFDDLHIVRAGLNFRF